MNESGQLDESWGYGRSSQRRNQSVEVPSSFSGNLCLSHIVRDQGILHSYCFEAFNSHATSTGYLADPRSLRYALNRICRQVEIEEMTEKETDSLWCSQLNFSEFLILSRELFTSMHRALSLDTDQIDAESH